jgi:chloramphenicol-sensitive protein RarD
MKGGVATGLVFAIAAYGLWGFLPLFFLALRPVGAIEIVAWRISLSLVFCALLLTVTRGWPRFVGIARHRRTSLMMGLAGIFILINWLVYVFAAVTGHIVAASLGYFANPIVTVLLGVIFLRERLRVAQWVAIGISAIAVLVLAINFGEIPWISLALAFSFGLYGFIKKFVGGTVDAITGLTLETAWLTPLAIAALVVIALTGGLVVGTQSGVHTALVLSAGAVTAIPLLFFAGAARRLPLVYIGLAQYLAPVLQFIVGVVIVHEPMPLARWVGFGLVWIALIVLTADMLRASRVSRAASLEPV